jgi:type II secretory pathway pseudopilin PulG
MEKKYTAFTLLEMLLVMAIMMIIMGMSFTSFFGLHDTIKMNEYMLNMEQDIRSVQRASMLLERDTEENWLYGLGIDFTQLGADGKYITFKWCTPFRDYGDETTRSKVPGYREGDLSLSGAYLPYADMVAGIESGLCTQVDDTVKLLTGYTTELTIPKSTVKFNSDVRYVVFESVTGRAFFYDSQGKLLNYSIVEGQVVLEDDPTLLEELDFTITSMGAAAPRTMRIHHLSGRIEAIVGSEPREVELIPDDGTIDLPPDGGSLDGGDLNLDGDGGFVPPPEDNITPVEPVIE